MRILWLNWKDLKNPEAGGAEVFTHEVAKRMVAEGYRVTLFTSAFPGASPRDSNDGVEIIRRGTKTTVQGEAKQFYEKNSRDFDLVVDEINTKPFMTPKFVKGNVLALIHQLAREVWLYETPFPVGLVGYSVLEPLWLNRYKDTPTVTVSKSSERDLISLGFKIVYVVREGLSYIPLSTLPVKEVDPTIIYLGRLTKAKRVGHLITSFNKVLETWPKAKLWIVGDGYQRRELESASGKNVTFFGKTEKRKVSDLLAKAWVMVYPSVREGFGLAVIEANAHGTPAVGYDVPGIRDAIQDQTTGILARSGSVASLTKAIIGIIEDPILRLELSKNALAYSKEFSWDRTASEFSAIVRTMGAAQLSDSRLLRDR
jgi:glycosyltransferase involved in cell wall biosynthesis